MKYISQENAPILEALEKMKIARLVPFDVPGHKRGRGNPELTKFLGEQCLSVDVNSMKDAVDAAYRLAEKGDAVLLSPCCASFDLFKNYEDRGEQFKEWVRRL